MTILKSLTAYTRWIAFLPLFLALPLFAQDFASLESAELQCEIGNNAPDGEHRGGYNGVFRLTSIHQQETLFVPPYAGLNLEHIFHRRINTLDRTELFEPRNAAMEFSMLNKRSARLHQPPTPLTRLESFTTFTLEGANAIDMEFRCRPTADVFEDGALGLFWASYINAPEDKSMYFLRADSTLDAPQWQQFCTQYHNHDSTIIAPGDHFDWHFPETMMGTTLFSSFSRIQYAEPFFYGRFRNMVWIVMFADPAGVRLTHSPSGGGQTPDRTDTCPAWDFQWILPHVEAGHEYTLHVRVVYKLWEGREDVLQEYRSYQEKKP